MEYSQDIIDKVPWMWDNMFGKDRDRGPVDGTRHIIPLYEDLAKASNLSLEDYLMYREAKELLNARV